ncbi:ribulose-phosphate 3-epimerase [Hydrogenivirga sp.]
MRKLLAPSILAGDWWNIGEQIEATLKGGADLIHFDVMDGHFVPNITVGPEILSSIRRRVDLPIDAHLMIENPDRYIPAFIEAGANWVSVHIENVVHIHRTLTLIKELGAKAGVVLNPGTPLSALEEAIRYADYVLLMSVNPGFSGQKFIERSLRRLSLLKDMRDSLNPDCLIEIDGGIKEGNIADVVRAGADVVVVGSGIFAHEDVEAQTRKLKELISSAVAV